MIDVVGFEGLYAVTEDGKVWSHKNKLFLAQRYDDDGYARVNLYREGKSYTRYIHRLVAEAYIPNPEGKTQVDHIDEVKTHNWKSNLRWATPGENSRHSNLGRKRTWSNKRRPIYCVELDQVFTTQAEASRKLNINLSALNRALRGSRETCGGYHWKYYEEVAEE